MTTPRLVIVGDRPAVTDTVVDALARSGASVRHAPVGVGLAPDDADAVVAADPTLLDQLAANERLRGRLWPLLSGSITVEDLVLGGIPGWLPRVVEAAGYVITTDPVLRGALEQSVPAAARRTIDVNPERPDSVIIPLLKRAFPKPTALAARSAPLKVVVAGHDFNFLTAILRHLEFLPQVDLRLDYVPVFPRHDEEASRRLVEWADVAFCEWCSPVAVWYSRNTRPGQRLVIRLHRMELYNDWTEQVDMDNVDQVICVSPHYARLTLEKTGWPVAKVACIPNYVDAFDLDRPKLPEARFGIGVIGIVPARKRLDLAFDMLARLRRKDPRYTLFVKSKMPWDYPWNWRRQGERDSIRNLLGRVQATPALREAVVFDGHGPDVSAWLRKIGFVLSTSDDESFHVGPAEGMCSGAIPALLPWPGSDTIYDRRWIHDDVDAMARDIHHIAANGSWEPIRHAAKRQAEASFDIPVVATRFERVLVENLPANDLGTCLSVPLGEVGFGEI